MPVREVDNLAHRVDQAAVGGDVNERHQRDAVVEHPSEGVQVDPAARVAGDDLDRRARLLRAMQGSDRVARVLHP